MSEIRNPPWLLVTVDLSRDAEELASALLFELGSTGTVTLEESSHSVTLGAYFNNAVDLDVIKSALEAEFERMGWQDSLRGLSVSTVEDQDWMQKWKEGFDAVHIGERLIIAPSWKLPADSGDRIVIQVDPGTGILAIAAALLVPKPGPDSRIVGIDVDPQAVEVARENTAINNVSDQVELYEGQPRDFAGTAFD